MDEEAAASQAVRIASAGCATDRQGKVISVDAETICLHGDGLHALSFARRIRAELAKAKIAVAHF